MDLPGLAEARDPSVRGGLVGLQVCRAGPGMRSCAHPSTLRMGSAIPACPKRANTSLWCRKAVLRTAADFPASAMATGQLGTAPAMARWPLRRKPGWGRVLGDC